MSKEPDNGILVGTSTYRSFLNDPDLSTQFNDLEFGRANIRIVPSPMNEFTGLMYDTGFQLKLKGSTTYGNTASTSGWRWPAPSSAPSRTRAARAASPPPASSAPGSPSGRTTPKTEPQPA